MTATKKITVGVLALQGAFIEHIKLFDRATRGRYKDLSFEFVEVRTSQELARCDGLVIPGGESTAISLIAERTNMLEPLQAYVRTEKPIWGTCAGLIFLAKEVENGKPGQNILGGIDVRVQRNAFGRQLDSFECALDFSSFVSEVDNFPTVFIRAPVISQVLSPQNRTTKMQSEPGVVIIESDNLYSNPNPVKVLHQLDSGLIVAVRQGNKLGTSFHPELSEDDRFHKWFIDEFILEGKHF